MSRCVLRLSQESSSWWDRTHSEPPCLNGRAKAEPRQICLSIIGVSTSTQPFIHRCQGLNYPCCAALTSRCVKTIALDQSHGVINLNIKSIGPPSYCTPSCCIAWGLVERTLSFSACWSSTCSLAISRNTDMFLCQYDKKHSPKPTVDEVLLNNVSGREQELIINLQKLLRSFRAYDENFIRALVGISVWSFSTPVGVIRADLRCRVHDSV